MSSRTVSVKLRAEVSQYMRNMREAGRATSDLEKATLRVQDALMAEEDAAGKVRVAESRLTEVRESGTASAAQLAQAEEQLATAMRQHEQARQRAIVLGEEYIDQQRTISAGADEATDSTEQLGRATERVAKRANLRFRLLAGAIGSALPAAAATASAALTAGLGAGFIALGAVAVRESERVQDAWSDLGDELSGGLAQDASILEGAFVDAADEISSAYRRLRPQLQQAFAASVPYVEDLTDGVTRFAENAMPGAVSAVENAGPVFDSLETVAARLGTTLGEFAAEISSYSSEAGQGIEHLGDLVDEVLSGLAPIIGDLTQAWADHGDEVVDAVGTVLDVLGSLSDGAIPSLASAVGIAAEALDGLLQVLEPVADAIGPAVGTWLALAGAMKAVGATRRGISGLATSVQDLGTSLRKADKPSRGLKGGLAGLALGVGLAADEMVKLNPNLDELTSGLERFKNTGDVSGEAARLFGNDLGELNASFDQLTDGGLTRFGNELGEFIPGMDFLTRTLGESEEVLGSLDRSLMALAEEGGVAEAQAAFDRLAERMGLSEKEVGQLLDLLPGFSGLMGDAAGTTGEAADAAGRAAANVRDYLDALRAATDPVFGLLDATERASEAQERWQEAIAKHGEDSEQARAAAVEMAEATRDLEIAARNGDLSYAEFSAQLDKWVAQGAITAAQADAIRARVDGARGAAERFTGTYSAAVKVRDEATGAIHSIQRDIDSLTGKTVRIRVDYYGDSPLSDRSINVGYAGTRGGSMMADGGLVGGYADGGRIPGFPSGGFFRGVGGPREDANLVALSDGEFVTNAADTARNLAALEAGNEGARLVALGPGGRPVAGMADGGLVRSTPGGGAGAAVVNNYYLSAPNYVGSHKELLSTLRKEVQTRGGNVQFVLGRGVRA